MNRRGVPPFMRGRATRGPNMYSIILLLQLVDRISTLDPKPPVTVALILFNLLVFYFRSLSDLLPPELVSTIAPLISRLSVRAACLQPSAVLRGGQWSRLLVAAFTHLSDTHVMYNTLSFLYKGVTLEAALGSVHFLVLILYLAVTSHALYILIAVALQQYGYPSTMDNCVAGFSGVLFGLKVIINSNPQYGDTANRIFHLPFSFIPGSIAPWSELLIASAMMPNVSFLGHLCGILAGLLYIYLPRLLSRFAHGLRSLSFISPFHMYTYRPFQGPGRRLHQE